MIVPMSSEHKEETIPQSAKHIPALITEQGSREDCRSQCSLCPSGSWHVACGNILRGAT